MSMFCIANSSLFCLVHLIRLLSRLVRIDCWLLCLAGLEIAFDFHKIYLNIEFIFMSWIAAVAARYAFIWPAPAPLSGMLTRLRKSSRSPSPFCILWCARTVVRPTLGSCLLLHSREGSQWWMAWTDVVKVLQDALISVWVVLALSPAWFIGFLLVCRLRGRCILIVNVAPISARERMRISKNLWVEVWRNLNRFLIIH
jgi:hypothetical protein